MRIKINLALVALASLLLSACSTTANISSLQNGATVRIKNESASKKAKLNQPDDKIAAATPRSESFAVSTFGKYEFKAELPGYQPFYGMLPRKFNGGLLALDILFFTPAMLFNLNGVYPYYEFDVEKQVLKYKATASEKWNTYQPSLEEINQSRNFFGEAPLSPQQYYGQNGGNTPAQPPVPPQGQQTGNTKPERLKDSSANGDISKEDYEKKRGTTANGVM